MSCREYYCYKLHVRSLDNSILLHAGRLLQQYVVDMYVKVESSRLDYKYVVRFTNVLLIVYKMVKLAVQMWVEGLL